MRSPTWNTNCVDWETRIRAGKSLIPLKPLFPAEAEGALVQMSDFRLMDIAGAPTIGNICKPWILDFARAIFGAYDRENNRQLIRYFFLSVSKKNGKSTLAAAIMLTALLRNWRQAAEYLILAPTIEVAGNSFSPAQQMIRADEELSDLLHVQEHFRTITHTQTYATLKIVAADNETVSGKKASGVLIDELWLFGKRANAENMLLEATGGLASRPEGFVIYLSTQSDTPPAGVFDQTLREFRDIRDGKVHDPESLGVLYEFPKSMIESGEYLLGENWHITNPNLHASVDPAYLRQRLRKAERQGEASVRNFAAKHLNVEMSGALRSDGWAGAQYWNRGAELGLDVDAILDRCEICTVGIDGGGLDDLLGVAVLGRERDTRRWLAWCHAMISPEGLERRKANRTAYEQFIGDGDLTLVDELPDDLDQLVAIVERVRDAGMLGIVGVDAMGLPGIIDALAAAGVTQEARLLEGVRQGIGLMGAIKAVERKLVDGTFKHGGQRLMAWCAGNARIVSTPTAARIARDDSGYGKIDPLMALFSAADCMSRDPQPKRAPQYQAIFLGGRKPGASQRPALRP